MLVSISNPVYETAIVIAVLTLILFTTLKRKSENLSLSPVVAEELKGLAILSIIFTHIGYFLVTDNRFLWPMSIIGGVSVNLFLFLSGYGLTVSMLRTQLSPVQFYRRRLSKLVAPLWCVVVIFVLLDFAVLGITYPWQTLLSTLGGLLLHADIYRDIDSPLWYLTLILVYYVLFPWIFSRKYPWLTAGIYAALGYLVVRWNPAFLSNVMPLYKVHLVAFPLGILVVWLASQTAWLSRLAAYLQKKVPLRYACYVALTSIIAYTAYYSGVNTTSVHEQTVSIITMFSIVLLAILLPVSSRALMLFGIYSYEIYLFHWPWLYRYDVLYKNLPASLATLIYLGLFLLEGWALHTLSSHVSRVLSRPRSRT